MLSINASNDLMQQWDSTIDQLSALYLAGISKDFKSGRLFIEEKRASGKAESVYHCRLSLDPVYGDPIDVAVEWEECKFALEQCFVKAKRYFLRRKKGL